MNKLTSMYKNGHLVKVESDKVAFYLGLDGFSMTKFSPVPVAETPPVAAKKVDNTQPAKEPAKAKTKVTEPPVVSLEDL